MASHKYGEIKYNVGFTVDKQGLQELKNQLQNIQKMTASQYQSINSNAPKELKQASLELINIKKEAGIVDEALKKAFNPTLGTTNIYKFNQELKGLKIDKIYQDFAKLGPAGVSAFRKIATELVTTNVQIKQSHKLLNEMAVTFKNTIRYGISSSVFNNFTNSISKAYNYVQKLDQSLNDIRIVTGQSADQMTKFAQQANKVAQSLGATTLDYTKGALIYYQQGLDDQQVAARNETTLKMANVLNSTAKEVSSYMTAIWNNFDNGSKSLEYYADVITALGAATASSSEEIAEGLNKFAAVADTVGLSYEYATAALATVVAQTRQSADTVGTAFKTIFARMEDLKLGNTLDDGTTLGKYSETLNKAGIAIKDQNGELRDMDDILNDMGNKWQSLNQAQRVALAQGVAGTRQYTQLVALMDNWDSFQQNLIVTGDATGNLQKQQDIYMESTEAHLNKLSAATERLMSSFLSGKGINNIVDIFTNLINLFANFSESIGGSKNLLLTLGSVGMQVFSSQIGTSLSTTITNLQNARQEVINLQDEMMMLGTYSQSEEISNDPVMKMVTEMRIRLNKNTPFMTQDQIKEAKQQIQDVSDSYDKFEQERIKFWTDLNRIMRMAPQDFEKFTDVKVDEDDVLLESDLKFTDISYAKGIVDDLSNTINKDIKETKNIIEESKKSFIELNQWIAKTGKISEENRNKAIEQVKTLRQQLEAITESHKDIFSSKDLKDIDNYVTKLKSLEDNPFYEQKHIKELKNNITNPISNISSIIDKTAKKTKETTKELQKDFEKFNEKDYFPNLKKEAAEMAKENAKPFDTMMDGIEQTVESTAFVKFLSGIGQLMAGLNSLANLKNIFNNDNLSVMEKFLQITMALFTGLGMIGSSIKNIKENGEAAAQLIKRLAVTYLTQQAQLEKINAGQTEQLVTNTLLNETKKETIKLNLKEAASNGTLTTSNITLTASFKVLGKAILSALAPLLPFIAAGAALAATIYAIVKAANKENEEIKSLEKASEGLKQQSEKLQSTVDNLNNSFDKYSSALETLNKCTIGTQEWNKACQDVNKTILEILQKYPTLAKIAGMVTRDPSTGLLTLNEDLYKEYTQQIQNESIALNAGAIQLQNQANTKKLDQRTRSISWDTNYWLRESRDYESSTGTVRHYSYDTGATLSTEEIAELSKYTTTEEIFTKKLNEMAKGFVDSGYISEIAADRWIKSMQDSREELQAWGNEFEANAIQVSNSMKIISNAVLGSNATNIETRLFGEHYQEKTDEYTKQWKEKLIDKLSVTTDVGDEEYKWFVDQLNKYSSDQYEIDASIDNAVRGWDGDNGIDVKNKITGEIESYTREQWAAILASRQAIEEWYGSATQDLVLKIPEKLREDTGNNLGNELINKIFNEDFNVNQLSEQEYELVKQYKDVIIRDLEEVGGDAAKVLVDSFNVAMKSEWDAEAYAEFLKQQFNNALTASATNDAEAFGLNKDDLKDFGQYLADIADESEELADTLDENGTAAGFVARSIMRMNDAIEDLNKNQEEWLSILKKSNKASEEYWKSLVDIRKAFSDLLNLEDDAEKYLDGDFFVEHSKDIQLAAEGNADAIDRLRQSSLEKIVIGIAIDNKINTDGFQAEVIKIQNDLNNLNLKLEAGVEIKEEDQEAFIAACNEMIEKAGLTTEQVNQLFSGMGYDVTFAEQPQKMTRSIPRYETIHTIKNRHTDPTTGTEEYTEETTTKQIGVDVLTDDIPLYGMSASEPGTTVIPKISKITKGASGTANNYSSKNKGGASLSKGGGSSSKPDKMDPIEKNIDRYHKVNTQITKVDNSLKKLQARQEKFVGAKLIDNLNQQWELLNTQIDNYNEKLKIAHGEQKELGELLASKGVKFNEDGTINNYAEFIKARVAEVNELIEQYNAMSQEQQEKNKEKVELAKQELDKDLEMLDRYDELVSDFIPDLRQQIYDALDKQIEINVKKFNMEIEISLNLNNATREWNDWVKTVIKGVRESNILGNANATLAQYGTYYNESGNGDVQTATRHVNEVLEEIRKMERGEDNVYGDNKTQALEDLQKYYTQLMESMSQVYQLQRDLHQAVMDEIEAVQEGFDKQVENYRLLNSIMEHDKKLIALVYGEDAYDKFANYYQQQQENYNKTLEFQRMEKEFWEKEMDSERSRAELLKEQLSTLKEGSAEWINVNNEYQDAEERLEAVTEKWKSSVENFNQTLEEGLQNAVDKFQNAINDIFKTLNNKVTNGQGLDYVKTEWDLINKNADRYLDTINSTYEIRALEKKYTEAINSNNNIKVQQRLKKVMDEQVNSLKEKDRITQYDIDRANKLYDIELARIALEDARDNKAQMRLRRDSQGNYTYQYVADTDALDAAQAKIDELYNSLYNFDKERYNQILNDMYDSWNEYQQAMAEAALINDPAIRAEREKLIQEQYNILLTQINKEYQDARYNLEDSFYNDWVYLNTEEVSIYKDYFGEKGEIPETMKNLSREEFDIINKEMIPNWENGLTQMAKAFSGEEGFEKTTIEAWKAIKTAENEYAIDVGKLETTSGDVFSKIGGGYDTVIQKITDPKNGLLKANQDVIDKYVDEYNAVKNVYDKVMDLARAYEQQAKAAKEAADAGWEKYQKELRIQEEQAKQQDQTSTTSNPDEVPTKDYVSSDSKAGGGSTNTTNDGSGGTPTPSKSPQKPKDKNPPKTTNTTTIITYTITKHYGYGLKDEKITVTDGQSITLPGSITINGFKVTGYWSIPSLGICTTPGSSFTYKPKKSETVTAYPSGAVSTATKEVSDRITKPTQFASGGYTGDWSGSNSDGRLAVLHQKELVLNAKDTENMLNTVAIMRNITQSLGSNTLARVAEISAIGANSNGTGVAGLEQDVHIDAQFPNVHSAAEIEQALNNLVNAAAQRSMIKR